MSKVTKHLKISGRVQGVGFRYSLCDEAIRKKAVGWVKNLNDGSVEAVIQAEEPTVLTLIEWIKKGPGASRVEDVQVESGSGEFKEFDIRY